VNKRFKEWTLIRHLCGWRKREMGANH